MRFFTASVLDCHHLGAGYSWLILAGCEALAGSLAGQFAMLRGDWGRDPILPRAFSVLWVEGGRAEFLVRRVGRGSERLGSLHAGDGVQVLGPLGRGFPDPSPATSDLLVAGGCGVAPLYLAARRALVTGRGDRCTLLIGARQSGELVLVERLAGLGINLRISTEDGSSGKAGVVTDLLQRELELSSAVRVLACGPEPMLRAVRDLARQHGAPCYLSVEAPMACGLGACMGCAIPGRDRPYLYVCQQGPVFDAEEVWP